MEEVDILNWNSLNITQFLCSMRALLNQVCLFFGTLYIYCAWRGHDVITDKDRKTVFILLTVISLVGCFLFFLIRKPDAEASSSSTADVTESLLPGESHDSSTSYRKNDLVQSVKTCFRTHIVL